MGKIRQAMGKVAAYIESNEGKLPQDCIVGITYTKLANASKRLGFAVPKAPLPEVVNRRFERTRENYGDISLCFLPYSEIISRFSSSNQPEKTA